MKNLLGRFKLSRIEDLTEGGGTPEHNVYLVWKNLLGRFKGSITSSGRIY